MKCSGWSDLCFKNFPVMGWLGKGESATEPPSTEAAAQMSQMGKMGKDVEEIKEKFGGKKSQRDIFHLSLNGDDDEKDADSAIGLVDGHRGQKSAHTSAGSDEEAAGTGIP